MQSVLSLENLSVQVEDKAVLRSLSLSCKAGELHALMGPNGSGKSTLAQTIMGHPLYQVTGGAIYFDGQDITAMPVDKRARAGLFLAFQYPYAIPGVQVFTFLREAYTAMTGTQISVKAFNELLEAKMALLGIDPSFAFRDLNDGFSGGEKKRLEMLQLLLFKPKVAVLDEIDSGLDVDALKIVAHGIAHIRKEQPTITLLVITHYQRILDYLHPDHVHIVHNGSIIRSGSYELARDVEQRGYDVYAQ